MTYILTFLFCLLVAIIGVYAFKKLTILDKPGPDVPPRKPVPTIQGIVLFLGFIGSLFLFFPEYITSLKDSVLALLLGGGLLVLIATIDEYKGIPHYVRLIIQLFAAAIAFFVGGVGMESINLWGGIEIEFHWIVSLIITLIWFVAFINAINWFDGINGLASGVSSIGFLTIVLLLKFVVIPFYTPGIAPENLSQLNLVIDISFILFVLSLIYTFIEFKPIGLLRDTGVMFLGYALAFMALLGGAKIGTILVVLSLVIFDAVWVFFNRLFKMKKNPLKKDLTHLHHRLMALNWNRSEIRFFIWGWSLFLMVLMILQGTDRVNKIIIFLLMFLIFFGVNYYIFWKKGMKDEYEPKNK